MPKAHIQNGALTIPLSDEIREKLNVHEGEELEAHVFEDGLTVTRTTADARRRAGERILATIDQIHPTPEQAAKPIEQVEEEIVQAVKEVRRAH